MLSVIFHLDAYGNAINVEKIVNILRTNQNFQKTFDIVKIDTLCPCFLIIKFKKYILDCTSSCSGHGICNNFTRDCVCDDFWMPNLIHMMISGIAKNDCCKSSLLINLKRFQHGRLLLSGSFYF